MRISPVLLAMGGLALAGHALAAPPPDTAGNLRFVPFEVIVKFKDDTGKSAAASQLAGVKLTSRTARFDVATLQNTLPLRNDMRVAKSETLALLAKLRQRDDVEYAQLNYIFDFSLTPSDPLYPQQWHYPLISLPSAWNLTTGSSATRIAILDSGRSGHPDLNGRWSPLEYNGPAPGQPATDNGSWRHGTHVAGIAGAAAYNGIGGSGVCFGCTLMNVKVGDTTTGISMTSIVASIDWATDNGARVINMSFESAAACTQASFPALRTAINRARDNGVNLVAAAGNNAVNVDNVTPASCPGVISVAASDRTNALATYSSRGPNIGVTAPGGASFYGAGIGCPADGSSGFNPADLEGAVSTWTTSPNSGNAHCYRHLGGTSMAAPHVAGTVGLMLSVNPRLFPEQVTTLIRGTAGAMPSCGSNCGPGLLNAYSAVNAALSTTTGPCSSPEGSVSKQCRIESLGQYVNSAGTLVESVYAYGYLWQFNAAGTQIGTTRKLTTLPRYANGPCLYAPAGQICVIDSATVLDYPGFGYMESVTAYGRYWNFDQNGNGLAGNGSLLSSVTRFANGPCLYAGGAPCRFDTRNLLDAPEWGGLYESITAYGRYWIFDAVGNLVGTDTLLSVPRFANGPCAYRPAGTVCTFGSRELRHLPSGAQVETVTAYGRYFEWDGNGNP
ncbi:MAG: S8 family serine peptidase, partial [Lysobacteraceae bacterium]